MRAEYETEAEEAHTPNQKSQHPSEIYQEGRDCPICLGQFPKDALVYRLKCNEFHIYHASCLDRLMSLDNENVQKCIICRQKFPILKPKKEEEKPAEDAA